MRSRDHDRAEVYLRRALEVRPDAPAALLALGVVESQRGDHERAIRYAERARALAPGGDIVHAQLGTIYGVAGRYADAAESFREAIARNPRRLHPRANLVTALADLDQLTAAATALGEAERVVAAQAYADPGDLRTLAELGRRLATQARRSP
jgi:tetratricopeptide (TPR) repeat protein